jgi:transposase
MKDLAYFNKIYLALQPVDFHKQAYGLAVLVKQVVGCVPNEGRALFVFTNRRKTALNILYWDTTGFALWWKGLEKDRFRWPKNCSEAAQTITASELKLLLQGIDLAKIKKHAPVDFSVTH